MQVNPLYASYGTNHTMSTVAVPDAPQPPATAPIPALDIHQMMLSFEEKLDILAQEMEQCFNTQPLNVKRGLSAIRAEAIRTCALVRHTSATLGAVAQLLDSQRQIENVGHSFALAITGTGDDPNGSNLL